MKESFVFYASFFEAIRCLPDIRDQITLFNAIGEYALYDTDPELSGPLLAVFCVVKPLIDANRKRRENGKKGGRPKKNTALKSDNQWFSIEKPNENENVNVNVNGNEYEYEYENDNDNGSAFPAQEVPGGKNFSPVNNCAGKKPPKFPPVTYGYDDDGKLHGIDENLMNYWKKQFPALNIEQELRNAESWLDSNRKHRKRNIKSFLTNWMIRHLERISSPPSAEKYIKFDGNSPEEITTENRDAFDGF